MAQSCAPAIAIRQSHESVRRACLARSFAVLGALAVMLGCTPRETETPPTTDHQSSPVAAALDWLMAQQQPDHLWHSAHYGNLKAGAAMTAFVLYAAAHIDRKVIEPHRAALQAACDALVPQIERRGFVANPDGPDYPTYASAMLLVAAQRLELKLPDALRERLMKYLLESQVDQTEGYAPGDPDFGGWDMEGSAGGLRRTTGTNISVGAAVAEALSLRPSASTDAALKTFRQWLQRCQNFPGDGGFFFHADRAHDGNKAGWLDESDQAARLHPRSYGSATADGLRGLKACGAPANAESIRAALNWLQTHPLTDAVPGFESSLDKSWTDGLLFYYWFALSKSFDDLPADLRRATAARIQARLVVRQAADGSWRNSSSRMREDDPLIATCCALIAFSQAERSQ